ncbi:MAG: hypothetical protein LPK88_10075 [Alphaproteobacteria bacterium]|nr:hypothetical protein [Alphaproteobacteria bacterium]MDX5416645.1 hypothetical protein [Alphaproteobacteria bacterium]MDX5494017.1 hypothetical protein [Alphaproteobacteria bacterium]
MKRMHRSIAGAAALAALLALAACDQSPEEEASAEAGGEVTAELPSGAADASDDPDDAAAACQAAADALGGVWAGRAFTEAESAIMAGEGIATIRVIRPGTMVTKDFRIDRLNVDVDESGKITRIYCG